MFANTNSNSSGKDIASTIGGTRMQYGSARLPNFGAKKLAFANPAVVDTPDTNARFDV